MKPRAPPQVSQLAGTVTWFLRRSDHGSEALTGQPRERNSGNADPRGLRTEWSGAATDAHTAPDTPAPDARRSDRWHERDHPPGSNPTGTERDRTPTPEASLIAHAPRDSRRERHDPPAPEDSRRKPHSHAVLAQPPRLATQGVTRGRDHATTPRALPALHSRDTSIQTMQPLIPHTPHPTRNNSDAGIGDNRSSGGPPTGCPGRDLVCRG